MRGDFVLDQEVAYLNHRSFSARTQAVFEEYQRLQLELEWEPTDFGPYNDVEDVDRLVSALERLL